ncbi:MAG: transcription termination/antitermination protein NusA, partial [Ruminococcaceae bacterium]|nr:transcription termination/antitermination protein NusA [Oscillospiraceae bacterium]
MNAEFFLAIAEIEKEKGIPKEYMLEKIQQALLTAYKRDNPECAENIVVDVNEKKKSISMYVEMDVVEEVDDPALELTLDEALLHSPKARVGDKINIPVDTKEFGRIAAQAAKQVIIQGIREAERGMIYDEFTSKEHEILTGIVSRIEPRTGAVSIKISSNSEY